MKRVPRIIRKCEACGNQFGILASTLRGLPGRGRFCSASCKSKVVVHVMLAVRGERWKSNVRKASFNRRGMDETKHPRWKGDNAGYYSIHDWITKHFGQPIGCENCGLNDPNRKYHWANISHTYRRRRDDFKRLCVPCHRKYDYAAKRAA